MVTLDQTAATNPIFVQDLIRRGMDCARINCAHDNRQVWTAMVTNVKAAAEQVGRPCSIYMDLAGPKIRTGVVLVPEPKRRLQRDDVILLTQQVMERPNFPFQMTCTLPEVLDHLAVGHSVWIDDGQIGCRVEEVHPAGVVLRVFATRAKGKSLKADKGLNFPNIELPLNPLTRKDLQDLDFAVEQADVVGYSFVQRAADIARLQQEIQARHRPLHRPLGIVAKIETPVAVTNLPELIVQAAGQQPFGVMIARGDLAVELGYQRLAEMQEEILWLCEAAHVPVIWATQVLENLTKQGIPSRAEITDAAMAERAECVMLNKGPSIGEAISILDDVLTRMQEHQLKKTPTLRALRSW
jgi:pyruvate kinase